MELSKRTQTIIALVSGIVLGAVVVAAVMQNYYKSQINQIVSQRTSQAAPADYEEIQPAPSSDSQSDIAATTTSTPEPTTVPEQAAEPQAPAAETPATNQTPAAAPSQPTESTPTAEPQNDQPTATQAAAISSSYTYTAKPGDSYSVLARKAVQTYGLKNHIALSGAQIIAAEAFLTTQAGSPELNEGQQVAIAINSVQSAVASAQKLSPDEQALWDTYTQDVEFNTNLNG